MGADLWGRCKPDASYLLHIPFLVTRTAQHRVKPEILKESTSTREVSTRVREQLSSRPGSAGKSWSPVRCLQLCKTTNMKKVKHAQEPKDTLENNRVFRVFEPGLRAPALKAFASTTDFRSTWGRRKLMSYATATVRALLCTTCKRREAEQDTGFPTTASLPNEGISSWTTHPFPRRAGCALRSLQQRSHGEAATFVLGDEARNSLQSCMGPMDLHVATQAQEMSQTLPEHTVPLWATCCPHKSRH